MSMFRKAASAIIPATVEPVSDTTVFDQVESASSTIVPEQAAAQDVAAPEAIAPEPESQLPKPLRSGSKGAALLALLQREEGASLDEMIERTGWQGHTVRAAMTGLRKKGHVIGKRVSGNSTVWFIAAEPAA